MIAVLTAQQFLLFVIGFVFVMDLVIWADMPNTKAEVAHLVSTPGNQTLEMQL